MRASVLLKTEGVYQCRVTALMGFIDSHENRPIDDVTVPESKRKPSNHMQYVTLIDAVRDSKEDVYPPTYKVAISVLTEFRVRDNAGGTITQTPRWVVGKVSELIGIFPNMA